MTHIEQAQQNIGSFLHAFRFDGKIFCVALQSTLQVKRETKHQDKYTISYCKWALEITKIQ